MIDIDDLDIVSYCHSNCVPLKNIMRLSKEEAFAMAYQMAAEHKETTAFYRFADFENYYPLRIEVDKLLYNAFISLGGNPKTEHPLSFVLQGSEYLDKWFDNGIVTKIPLKSIPSEFISFTYGDSMAVFRKTNKLLILKKETLSESMRRFQGTIDEYRKEIAENHGYIEVQLWNDDYAAV